MIELNVKEAVSPRTIEGIVHRMKVAEAMSPDPREYEYRGEVNDLGNMSGKCACGHAIRYEFILHHKRSSKTVVIGSVCIDSTVPFLISAGAESLAEQLRAALEAHEEAKKEAMRQLRDARNSEQVQDLERYWDEVVVPWFTGARAAYKERHGQQRYDSWRREYYTHCYYPEFLYRALPKLKAQSTPGRTANSIRSKIVGLAYNAFENEMSFPEILDEKVKERIEKKINERIDWHERMARYYPEFDIDNYKKRAADFLAAL